MLKNYSFVAALLFIFSTGSIAQNTKYIVRFTDKNNSPYSLSRPLELLSQKSLDRRTRQKIALDAMDIPVNPSYIKEVSKIGVTILNQSRWFNLITIETADSSKLSAIRALAFVKKTEPVGRRVSSHGNTPVNMEKFGTIDNKPFAGQQQLSKSSSFDYGNSYNQIHMLNGDSLHNMGYRGQGMTIAVLDAGFYHADQLPAFDSLWAHNQILGTRDFVAGGTSVFEDDSHGMSVLSTMGGNIPGQLIGTAPKAHYWLLRSENAPTEYIIEEANWASAAEYADSVGADVINSSLGYTEFDDSTQNHTYADMNGKSTLITLAADIAASKGIVVVNSAGNEGGSTWHYIGAPADAFNILAIGAVRANGDYSPFSSQGPSYDGRVKPNVAAQGSNVTIQGSGGSIVNGSGTSFSGPIIAGMVASFWQARPELTNMQVIDLIQKSASQYNTPDVFLGYGIPDFAKALQTSRIHELNTGNVLLKAYPNPMGTNEALQLSLQMNKAQHINIKLYDTLGKVIIEKAYAAYEGENSLIIEEMRTSAAGLYLLQVTTENETISLKIVK